MTSGHASVDPNTAWDDPIWRESSDNRWQSGLRLQQTWWRKEVAVQPAGPVSANSTRLVGSMLPTGTKVDVNLMTPEAVAAYVRAKAELAGRPGMIQEDRLVRNLLSSQPLCFNLFGYLAGHREALLPWVREFDGEATGVEDIQLEWAPSVGAFSGSAFDAFVEYPRADGSRGFVGVECKYHENLKQTLRASAADKFITRTTSDSWNPEALSALNRTGLRQFWYNQLLVQHTKSADNYAKGFGVVVACAADSSAEKATTDVREQLADPAELRFSSIEHVVSTITGHDKWAAEFTERYTDFSPIRALLPARDPRL